MTTQNYHWQRYLCPANESYTRTTDGFLIAPEEPTLWRSNQYLRTVASLADEPCFVILGEPGIGKSRIMHAMADMHWTQARQNDAVIKESFAGFATASDLRGEVFQSPTFEHWRRGTGTLYLFFDGLDEAHERVDVLMQALLRNLSSQPCERLFLRLSCRTTIWPMEYEQELCRLWKLETLPVYKVAVLSRQDVRMAAEANKIMSDDFLKQLVVNEVTPFAVIPITLELLLQLYDESGTLPKSRSELYAKGCQQLCEERNPQHQRAQSRSMMVDQRLLVAARIAALSFLGRREVIDSSVNGATAKETHLHLQELVGYGETFRGQKIGVTDRIIKEVLDTGLFAPLAADQYGWVHRTFQEYLTAYYLVQHLDAEQILQLLEAQHDPKAQFPPQFRDVIGWLATLSEEVKREILQRDPAVLLTSDISALSHEDRVQIVDWLLTAVDQQQHFARFAEYQTYQKLWHPGLPDQLQPVLMDVKRSLETRRLAVDLAERNVVNQLQELLVQLALDSSCPLALRVDAAQAVAQIGDDKAKQRLKPLLYDPEDDEQQRLKGAALRALWPKQLTAQELFAVLRPRGQDATTDLYHVFVTNEIVDNLQITDLPEALVWVAEHTSFQPADQEVERIKDGIIDRALMNLDIDEVRAALVTTLLIKLEHHDTIAGSDAAWEQHEFLSDKGKRRYLFKILFEQCVDSGRDVSLLLWPHPALVMTSDLPWLLEELYPQLSELLQRALITVIGRLWYYEDVEQTALIYAAIQKHKILAEHFAHKFIPVQIDSEEADQMRKRQQRVTKSQGKKEESTAAQDLAQIEARLAEVERDIKFWWQLNLTLMIGANGVGKYDEREHDITKMPGWAAASDEVQQRIVATAMAYLAEGEPNNANWVNEVDMHDRPAQAGYRAFWLLYRTSPHSLEQLPASLWGKWALVIVTAHRWTFSREGEVDEKLIALLARNAPDTYIAAVVQALQTARSAREARQLAQRIDGEWHAEFSASLWQQMARHVEDAEYLRELLPYLLRYDLTIAKSYAAQYLPSADSEYDTFGENAIMVASDLLGHAQDAGWSILWPIIRSYSDFGKRLLLYTARELRYSPRSFTDKFDVPDLAVFYEWMVAHFPYVDDPPIPSGGYTPTPHHHVCRLRDSLLTALVNVGTREAVDAIAIIVSQNPTIPDGERDLYVAQEQWRRHSWQPIQPAQLLELVHAADSPTFDQRHQHVGVQYNIHGDLKITNESGVHQSSDDV